MSGAPPELYMLDKTRQHEHLSDKIFEKQKQLIPLLQQSVYIIRLAGSAGTEVLHEWKSSRLRLQRQ
ncbi:hypothetical protein Mapa_003004 [Marchantia paleacea]|nr:hypothetical protein Mapa_003004 [Marchantia paleacea]